MTSERHQFQLGPRTSGNGAVRSEPARGERSQGAPNPSFEPRIELGPKIAFAVVNRLVGLVPRLFTSLIVYPAQLLRDRLCFGRAVKILGGANWGVDDLRGVVTLLGRSLLSGYALMPDSS